MKLVVLMFLALVGTWAFGDESWIVVNIHEATPTIKLATLEIRSVDLKKSWYVDLDRSPYDDGAIQSTFVSQLPFSGKVKFVWTIKEFFDPHLKGPRAGVVDKNTYFLKSEAWNELPNVVAEKDGTLDPDFMGSPLSTYVLSGYDKAHEGQKAHLLAYPNCWIASSMDPKDVVARVPPQDGLSNFDPTLLSFEPGTWGIVHPDSSLKDDPQWLISDSQEFEAGTFYALVYEEGALAYAYPVEWVDPRSTP